MGATPRDAALRILALLFAGPGAAAPAQPRPHALASFQEEGVDRLRRVLADRGGAILADSVGLGKTYTAVALLAEQLEEGGEALVVVPAALRAHWRRALRPLPGAGARWRLLSHTQLARGVTVAPPAGPRLVVVDEAHRFRNPATLRYAALARLATPGTRLLLITATPINNHPGDLLSLLRLFCRDDTFRDIGVPSLAAAFDAGSGVDAAGAVRKVVRAAVVRRTRAQVADRFGLPSAPLATFPVRAKPRVVHWDDGSVGPAVRAIEALELAPYSLGRHGSSDAGAVAELLRLLLLKRLDSSRAALAASVERLRTVLRSALDAATAGRVPAAAPLRPDLTADADPLQLLLPELIAEPAPPDIDLAAVAESLRRDLETLRRLTLLLQGSRDPKLAALHALVGRLGGEKLLLFTEYRDTAETLGHTLAAWFRVGRVDGGGAWLGRRRAGRRAVVERFAPAANGRPPPPDRERVDLLVATDVLAEGLNLQDARHMVSYELPWNPVRLLQRIGRIDRLGSPHTVVVPHLFVPARGLDQILGLRRKLQAKLRHITATVGADEAGPLLDRLARAADGETSLHRVLVDLERSTDDPVERLRTLWVRHREAAARETMRQPDRRCPGHPAVATACPSHDSVGPGEIAGIGVARGPEAASTESPWALLIAEQSGRVAPAHGRLLHSAAEVLEAVLDGEPPPGEKCDSDRPIAVPVPLDAIRTCLAGMTAEQRAPAPLGPRDPAARLARHLRGTLAATGAALHPDLLGRADRLLDRLSAPLPPVVDRAVRAVLERDEPESLPAFLDRIEGIVLGAEPRAEDAADGPRPHVAIPCDDAPPPTVGAWLAVRSGPPLEPG